MEADKIQAMGLDLGLTTFPSLMYPDQAAMIIKIPFQR